MFPNHNGPPFPEYRGSSQPYRGDVRDSYRPNRASASSGRNTLSHQQHHHQRATHVAQQRVGASGGAVQAEIKGIKDAAKQGPTPPLRLAPVTPPRSSPPSTGGHEGDTPSTNSLPTDNAGVSTPHSSPLGAHILERAGPSDPVAPPPSANHWRGTYLAAYNVAPDTLTLSSLTLARLQSTLATLVATSAAGLLIPNVPYLEYLAWTRNFVGEHARDRHDPVHQLLKAEYISLPGPGHGTGGVVIRGPATPYHDAVANYVAQKTDQRVAEAFARSGRADVAARAQSQVMVECNSRFDGFASAAHTEMGYTRVKQPDLAFLPADGGMFPTVVIEVGFSQTWASLLEDAKLFLLGTGGVTTLVLLVKLVEAAAPEAAATAWPAPADVRARAGGGSGASPGGSWERMGLPPPPHAPALSEARREDVCKTTIAALRDWYMAVDAQGRLRVPLVGKVSGEVAYHRVDAQHEAAVVCTATVPLLRDDQPVSPPPLLRIPLRDILGRTHRLLAGVPADAAAEFPCAELAAAILARRGRMQAMRAGARAASVMTAEVKRMEAAAASVMAAEVKRMEAAALAAAQQQRDDASSASAGTRKRPRRACTARARSRTLSAAGARTADMVRGESAAEAKRRRIAEADTVHEADEAEDDADGEDGIEDDGSDGDSEYTEG
ncbi:hypothetical protein DFH27DRAFT_580010 [Peziza echinospora]|nr:hypothetical protein DFH27DRAFT_580010 [Peziza echinospora]